MQIGVGFPATDLVAADFDGDGRTDLFASFGRAAPPNGSALLLGVGGMQFRPAPAAPAPFTSVRALDVDGDGFVDLIGGTPDQANVRVVLGNGDGTFQPPADYPTQGAIASLTVADFNLDGRPDVATAGNDAQGNSSLAVRLGLPGGALGPPLTITIGRWGELVPGDFNGDGRPDLLIAADPFQIYLGQGDGTFAPGGSASLTYRSYGYTALTAFDMTGDGKLDVVAAHYATTTELEVLAGDGSGGLVPGPTFAIPDFAVHFASADLDRDGVPELLAVTSSQVMVFKRSAGSAYTLDHSAPVSPGNGGLALADLDGDGVPELIGGEVIMCGCGVPSGQLITVVPGSCL